MSPIQLLLISRKPNTGSTILSFFFFQLVYEWGFQTQWKSVQIWVQSTLLWNSSVLYTLLSFLSLYSSTFPLFLCIMAKGYLCKKISFPCATVFSSILLQSALCFYVPRLPSLFRQRWPIFPHVQQHSFALPMPSQVTG